MGIAMVHRGNHHRKDLLTNDKSQSSQLSRHPVSWTPSKDGQAQRRSAVLSHQQFQLFACRRGCMHNTLGVWRVRDITHPHSESARSTHSSATDWQVAHTCWMESRSSDRTHQNHKGCECVRTKSWPFQWNFTRWLWSCLRIDTQQTLIC